ncbi:MAG: triose-phosphate isomerase, partial [Acidobacteriota bacterium]
VCIGENLYERQAGETGQVVQDQLAAALVMLTAREVSSIVIAYEPVWAIGTGEIARPEQIKQTIAAIRKTVHHLCGDSVAAATRVLYGGSVVSDLAADYLKIKGLDGFLVGGASLRPLEFSAIVKAAQRPSGRPAAKTRH